MSHKGREIPRLTLPASLSEKQNARITAALLALIRAAMPCANADEVIDILLYILSFIETGNVIKNKDGDL